MSASYTRVDLRQTIERDLLQSATAQSGSLGDSVARGLDKEVTRPYYFTVTGSSRVLTVAGAGLITNAESSVSHANPAIVGVVDPRTTSFTVTFPSASAGTATSSITIDSGSTVTVSSNNYINVGVNLAPTGNIALTYGTQNTVAASATAPAIPAGYLGIGYVQLFNNAGAIANLANSSLVHYHASRYSEYLATVKTVAISGSTTLTDNALHFVDTTVGRSLTLPAPSKSSSIIIKDSTGNAGTNSISILQHASENIEGVAATYVFSVGNGALHLTSDGTNWFITDSWVGVPVSTSLAQFNVPIGNSTSIYTATNTNLLGTISAKTSSATVTMTNANPGVVTQTAHGASTGDTVYFMTTGALPTNVPASTTFWITKIDANTYNISSSLENLYEGVYVNTTSGVQSGVQTAFLGGLTLKSLPTANPAAADGAVTMSIASAPVQVITPTVNRTYTLPTTGVLAGMSYTFINNSAVSLSDIKILVNSSAGGLVRTIWSQTSAKITALKDTPTLSTDWICETPAISNWTIFSPVFTGFGTVSSSNLYYRRYGDSIQIRGSFTAGTVTSATASISLPNSYTSASTMTSGDLSGTWTRSAAAGAAQADNIILGASVGTFAFAFLTTAAGGLTPQNGNVLIGNGETVSLFLTAPISGFTAVGG